MYSKQFSDQLVKTRPVLVGYLLLTNAWPVLGIIMIVSHYSLLYYFVSACVLYYY